MRTVVAFFLICIAPYSAHANCQAAIKKIPVAWQAGRLISHIVEVDAKGEEDVDCLLSYYHKLFVKPAPLSLEAQYYYNHIANRSTRSGAYDTAMHYAQLALRCDSLLADSFYLSADLGLLANIHLSQGEFETAIDYYQRSLRVLDKEKHPANALSMFANLGIAYSRTAFYETALQYFQKAMQYGEKVNTPYARRSRAVTRLNIGIINKHQGELKAAIEVFSSLIDTARQYEYPYLSYLAHLNIAKVYRSIERTELAQSHLDTALFWVGQKGLAPGPTLIESLFLAYEAKEWERLNVLLEKYGAQYTLEERACDPGWAIWKSRILSHTENKYQKALELLNNAIACNERYSDEGSELYEVRSEVYQLAGGFRQALEDFTQAAAIRDSLTRRSNLRILADMTTSQRVKEYQDQLLKKEAEQRWLKKQQAYMRFLTSCLAVILILLSVLFYFFRQRMQLRKQMLEDRKQQLEDQNQAKSAELSLQKKRLLAQSVQANRLKARVLEACEKYRRNPDMLKRRVEMAFNATPRWENFLLEFNDNFPGFIAQLQSAYPNISQRQFQYLVLIALGFTNQEIGEVLYVTQGAVEKAKARIAETLQLDNTRQLSSFLTKWLYKAP